MSAQPPDLRFRFGVFEADATTGELRKMGVRIKLNAQPFQVLTMLLARPGDLLTREEIARELWPDGTFVDAEHGVNSAVNRIREALGDKASNPRFVETLARRGYRFVAPVERIGTPANEPLPVLQVQTGPDLTAARPVSAPGTKSLLATAADLPATPHGTVQVLFILLQLMYLSFYVGTLANLGEIGELYAPLPFATGLLRFTLISAAVLIPARAFVISAALFSPPQVQEKLLQIWPFLLAVDLIWSLAPFLLLHHINFGLALACTALLVYSPFAQRALVLMGAGSSREAATTVT